MSPGTRRSLTLGAAAVFAATALLAGPVAPRTTSRRAAPIVVGEWQAANQLNPFLTNSLKDQEPSWRIAQRTLATVNDAGRVRA